MTGVSRAPRASSSTRTLRPGVGRLAGSRLLGPSVILAAFAASACQSELADGNPNMDPDGRTPFTGINPGGPGGNMQPGGPGGVSAPGNDGVTDPNDVMNSQEGRDANITGTGDTGPLFDENGMPLPVDQLPALQSCAKPGPQILRRLNSTQFRNTLRSVFNDLVPADANPLNDPLTLGYDVDSDDLLIQGLESQAIGSVAETISAAARQNGLIQQLANNCTNLADNNCRVTFVNNVASRLYREPLDNERRDRLVALFTAQGPGGEQLVTDFADGAELVIQAAIQSPYMLFRREIGTPMGNGEFQLTQHEIASELAYMLTNNPPDDQLRQAADNNQLGSSDQILAQAERLLQTETAQDVLGGFVTAWLDVDRLESKVKAGLDIAPELREAMLEETRQLFLDVFFNGGTIGDLFSAQYTFMNQELASFYGMQGAANAQDFSEVDISGDVRVPGVLGHGSYLAAHALADNSSPVQRAFVVRERILCNDLPPVPSDLDTNLRPQPPDATSRDRYRAHSENGVCYNCHQLMDPVGFTFESYDGYGRFRETESGKPIDSSGALPLMDESGPIFRSDGSVLSVPMGSVVDLANYLSLSEQARACLVNNLSYYAYGIANANKWASDDKVCTDHFIRQVARDSNNTLRSVMTGILTAPHFTRRVQAN
jgi:hypothetical protein